MPRKHLFTSIAEVQSYYPFQDNEDFFDALLPTLRQVERKYLLDIVDATTWQALLDQIDAGSYTNETWEELAERTMQAAANLVALYHMSKANVVFSSGGLLVTKTDQMVPASEFRTKELKKSLFRDVQDALDQVIDHLEANTVIFTDWAASDQRAEMNGLIIRTADEFDRFYSIGESRFLFRKLLPSQRYVIETHVKAVLGKEFLEAFIDDMADGLSEENQVILPQLQRGIAYLTMGHAVPRIQQQFGPEGIAIFDSEYQVYGARRQEGDLSRLQYLQDDAISKGESELADLKYFLDENATDSVYADYFNSAAYADPSEDHTDLNDYDDEQNHWAL